MTLPDTMRAMVTMGHGEIDQMVLHTDWLRPEPAPDQVLVRVGACGLNNTDVNTRSGWYSKAVTEATTGGAYNTVNDEDPTWGAAPISFPRIQGADVCGEIVAVGVDVDPARIGERIITDNWLRDPDDLENLNKTGYFGSECDGGFAEYTVMPSRNARAVNSPLSDAELATFSCSYSTAEGMLTRANVTAQDTVLVPGASGGVGGALVQLAKRRGARVVAMASEAKQADVAKLNPDLILPRAPDDLRAALGDVQITVVADVVGGSYWPQLIDVIERGGRYTCSGAIAGPMVDLDLRTLYLRDLTFTGSTVIPAQVMTNMIAYIEEGAIAPVLAATYALEDIHAAQTAFIEKTHTGNIVVTP
ncbi:alcohol dehydrogenase family protein [Thalassobium sp. R2A62]|uniref:alcohol dehydrogenase family protein n=1 Tax=Thalassobium sp. R2A62 TaxID=633131 RepID=UPI0001B1D30D|nr:alcohol dehydrogenase family protein [Thalassobium sp. R2A62]EET49795.1 alcohol dehydrogenase, zinc-containing [Thalassobium sp. R2A62]